MNIWGSVPILLVLAFFIGLFAVGPAGPSPALYWLLGIFMVIFLPTVLIVSNSLRCPKCGGTLGPTVPYGGLPIFRLPKKVTHCPLCGLNLDEELKDESANQQVEGIRR